MGMPTSSAPLPSPQDPSLVPSAIHPSCSSPLLSKGNSCLLPGITTCGDATSFWRLEHQPSLATTLAKERTSLRPGPPQVPGCVGKEDWDPLPPTRHPVR